ncbi:tripartite tricarboxylate transporter TctB family protein [Lacisediminimonas profundi]|uniref:tripartite tricarboxylate transporter TctB family protein n=1 Tax=Lacisediminimonas profundi TaxID=2603856 RepID=UPI00124B97C3|nr:tripartite tricarboxylate transporter TctB family protein [Lacisediminimonas profundi]
MHIRNQKDFWAGVMFILFGGFFAGVGTQYTFGTAARMGPGYFPTVLGIILMLLGLIVAVTGLSPKNTEEKVQPFAWGVLFTIIGSVVLFGVLLNPLGLIGSLLVLILLASYASHEHTWKASIGNSVVLISLCLFVFVYSLKLQFQLWPVFMRG